MVINEPVLPTHINDEVAICVLQRTNMAIRALHQENMSVQ